MTDHVNSPLLLSSPCLLSISLHVGVGPIFKPIITPKRCGQLVIVIVIMVELTVSVESGVMVAGETFSCLLNFANTSAHPQTVAWAGAQLHCQCNFKKDVVRLPSRERNKSVSSPVTTTAFFPSRGQPVG